MRKPQLFAAARDRIAGQVEATIDRGDFPAYETLIVHDWMSVLTRLAFILVPMFFILDVFMSPAALLPRFAVYRLLSSAMALASFFIVRRTSPGRWTYFHGYLASVQVGATIALMTVDLGGFNSSYYAGLNLVIIGVNLLLPWRAGHAAANSAIILAMYLGFNLAAGLPFDTPSLLNNMFFLTSTAIIAISIDYQRHGKLEREFRLLVELKKARDALWSEMELAKRIQTALLPKDPRLQGYEIAVAMQPAREVGGDYYDIIETPDGEKWVAIGDVSGHGVDAGLIMMMAQTSVLTVLRSGSETCPTDVLSATNSVIRENIKRLGSNHYMSMMLLKLNDSRITVAGHHQDLLVYRSAQKAVSAIATKGTWLGITDELGGSMEMKTLDIAEQDALLLFTDGVTEATNDQGEMFGQQRLEKAFEGSASFSARRALEWILGEMQAFHSEQLDDMTLVLVRKVKQ
jgi:serine phosphatase RsbU (regulator of sigma subunit)